MKAAVGLLLAALLFTGCIALHVDEAKLASMYARGAASLEPSSQDKKAGVSGPRVRRFYAQEVDVPKQKPGGFNRVAEVAPGVRQVRVAAYIQEPRFGGFDLYTAAAFVVFEAHSGGRYRVDGRYWGESVEMWISDVATNQRVSEVVSAPLGVYQHRAPIIIPIGG